MVELLLEALLGEVYDPDGPAPERAAETLDQMDPREASLGLTEVLCGRADDQVKGAAVDGLVALGGLAEPDLVATLDDPGAATGRARRSSRSASSASTRTPQDEEPDAGDDDAFGAGDDSVREPDDQVAAGEDTTASPRPVVSLAVAGGRDHGAPAHRAETTRSQDRPPAPTSRSTTPTRSSSSGSSRTQATSRRRPNVAQRFLNTGFIFTCESVHKPRTAMTVAPPTVSGSGCVTVRPHQAE